MKKKGTYVALAVIMAVLLLGIGYAAVASKTLTITGNAAADFDNNQFNVEFTDGQAGVGEFTPKEVTANGKEATFNVGGMKAKNDEVTFTYTIQNKSKELVANLVAPDIKVTGNESNYFSVTSAYTGKTKLNANETTTLTVTVKLLKTPATVAPKITATINLVANPEEAAA